MAIVLSYCKGRYRIFVDNICLSKYNEDLFKTPLSNIIQVDFDPILSKIENLMPHLF